MSPGQPYSSSREHLTDELRRIDQLVRAQTTLWKLTIGRSKSEELWGMVHVSEKEVDTYLSAPFVAPWEELSEVADALAPYRKRAEELTACIDTRVTATSEIALRLRRLQDLFGLGRLELDILLLTVLPDLDSRYRRLYGYLQDDASRTKPVVELLVRMVGGDPRAARAAFGPTQPLLRHRLLSLAADHSDEPAAMRPVRVDDRIAAFVIDSDAVDGALDGIVTGPQPPCAIDDLILDQHQRERLRAIGQWLGERAAVLFLHGPYGVGKLAVARALCASQQHRLITADVRAALRSRTGWEHAVDLAFREALLQGAAISWRGFETLLDREQPSHRLDYLIAAAERFPDHVFLASETAWDPAGRLHDRPYIRLDLPVPNYRDRARLWDHHLPGSEAFIDPVPERSALTETLANAFQFTPGQLLDAIATGRSLAARRDPLLPRLTTDDLYDGCRHHSSRQLISFARRIEPRTELTFDDLVLPAPNKRQLQELRNRVRHRTRVYNELGFERRLTLGRGLIVMFTGSSGTGKTMAAELLAREQRVDLFKVDLSQVVSKYVGETEKNLSRVFEEAECSNSIIFFDEADALFGKRGEVKEAQDRWANIEVNYLLQRVEEYSGIVILASNLRQNIDEAFHRRIHCVVEFPAPDSDARQRIWLGLFPPGVARPSDLDIRDLADRFRLPGGSIRNIVLDSAFRAMSDNGEPMGITMRHLVLSAAREYQKLGKPITRGEFDSTYYDWVEESLMKR